MLMSLLAGATAAFAAQSDRRDIEGARDMLQQIKLKIREEHFNAAFGGADYDKAFAEADQRIAAAKSTSEALAHVAQTVLNFGDSHTYFVPPMRPYRVRYGWQLHSVGQAVFVEAVRPDSDAAKQGVRAGERVLSVNGMPASRETLHQIEYLLRWLKPAPAVRVVLQSADETSRTVEFATEMKNLPRNLNASGAGWLTLQLDQEGQMAKLKSQFLEAAPGVLLWKLPTFMNEEDVKEALSRCRRYTSVVLDLRGNGGGLESAMLTAIGAFLDHKDEIGASIRRGKSKPMVVSPPLAGAINAKLCVLIDGGSASASEVVARALQLEKRAVILGDRSAGMVNRSIMHALSIGTLDNLIPFGVVVSESALVMKDGQALENTGVEPDVWLVPSAKDLASGADPVLAVAAKMVGVALTKEQAGAIFVRNLETTLN